MNELRYAGFWRRAGAHAIDTLLFVPLLVALLYLLYGPGYFLEANAQPLLAYRDATDFFLNQVLPVLLIVGLWARFGATPGKYLMHCRIVDLRTGERPRAGRSLLRYFGYVASLLPLGLGFLWIAWDRRKQGFHDKIAGTAVIYQPEDDARKSLDDLMREGR